MAGQVHILIQKLIDTRSSGNTSIASTTRTKLLLKGINSTKWNLSSPDDAAVLAKVRDAAKEMGVLI